MEHYIFCILAHIGPILDLGYKMAFCRKWKGEWNTILFLRIGSYWLDFKSGVPKEVYCNGVILLAGKGRGTLHFLYIMASTGPIFNLEYKKAFVVMAFFF